MTITLSPELEAALNELSTRQEWERGLLAAARPSGVSLPDWAVSCEGLYE